MSKKSSAIHGLYLKNIGTLTSLYPAIFNKEFPMPLAIGTRESLLKMKVLSPYVLGAVLSCWTCRREYTMMALSGLGTRFDIYGDTSPISAWDMAAFASSFEKFKNKSLVEDFGIRFENKFGYKAFGFCENETKASFQRNQMEGFF